MQNNADIKENTVNYELLFILLKDHTTKKYSAFNFREFFRTWTGKIETDGKSMPEKAKIGDFMHKDDGNKFLNLLASKDEYSNYPYSTEEYRDYFRH